MARPAEEFFPIEELQMCVNAVLRREAAEVAESWAVGWVSAFERRVARDAASRGDSGERWNLLITDGCQQAFDLISKAFVRPGDSVIMENPTYPGAVAIFTVRAHDA